MSDQRTEVIEGGDRLAIYHAHVLALDFDVDGHVRPIEPDPIFKGWWVAWSPRNFSHAVEGTWDDWVRLARGILAENDRRQG